MKYSFNLLLLTILLSHVGGLAHADSGYELRVGIFQMKPLNFIDDEGTAQGLYPDILREIVRDEQWRLVFVPGSWGQCYDRLLKGEIDLLTTVAFSQERSKALDYNHEAVADIWGKVYTRSGTKITDINDLEQRPVAVARKDINGKNFLKTAQKLGVEPRIIEVESHYDIFTEISQGRVDAGVVPQHFGFREAAKYNVVPTTIEFEPFSVFFAAKKASNSIILEHIDEHLSTWKRDQDSFYYKRIAYWMGGVDLEREVVPDWVYIAFLSVLTGIVTLGLVSAGLKRQVRLRTQELADREARFRKLSETTKAIPWELDPSTAKFTYVGPRIVDVFGFPADEWVDMQSWVDKIHPDDRAWAVEFCALETSKGLDHDFVYRGIHKDGREIWVHDIVTVSMGAKGPEKIYGYFVDVTEIREHEQRFQKMFREHNAIMLLIDPESTAIVDANTAACNFYGYTHDELVSMSANSLDPQSEDGQKASMRQATQKEQNYFEFVHRLANGTLRNIETYSYPIVIKTETLLFAIVHDITERKKLLEEHGRAEQLAALGTVAAGVAHEINNPIQGILNYAALLEKSPGDGERVLDISRRITKESCRIAKITRELLHYAKDNRDEMKVVCMKELVESALSLILPKTWPSGVEIETDLIDGEYPIKVNPQGVQQIVINLVDNAYYALRVKDIDKDEKLIKVSTFINDANGKPGYCIEVQDNGIGMAAEVVAKARDAFFSTKPSSEGSGLGLSIVNEIIGKHRGSLEIDSREGEYTRVTVCLPITP